MNNFNNETLNIFQIPIAIPFTNTAIVKVVPKYQSGDLALPSKRNNH